MSAPFCTPERVFREVDRGIAFNAGLDLYDTVRRNEDFFIGRQWEGVRSNGLPTPVFNFLKRVVMYLVASTATDNLKISATPLSADGGAEPERLCKVVNAQFEALFEQTKAAGRIRDFMRNAAVDGDGCLYVWFDPDAETGQTAKGAIRLELMENTRVLFGDPNRVEVECQPYLLLLRREEVDELRRRAAAHGCDPDQIRPDADENNDPFDLMAGGKATLATRLWRDRESGTIHAVECTRNALVRPAWDTGLRRYPIVWMPWDRVPNCYHGQAAVTGLIPNQIFVNKAYAMSMISLMSTAYPKIVYDKTRVAAWNNGVGQAIGVNGGDVSTVARAIEPAAISPQISQFIQSAIDHTKEFMGATDAALGDVRPENTSAILALQKASAVPMELVKQNLFQCVEDLAAIWLDQMRAFYGTRAVRLDGADAQEPGAPAGSPGGSPCVWFDFSSLENAPLSLKLDVGGSAYWSEITQLQTLDNLLAQGKIDIVDYLERVPNGHIIDQQALIDKLKAERSMTAYGTLGTHGISGSGG